MDNINKEIAAYARKRRTYSPEALERRRQAARERYAYKKNSPKYQKMIQESHIRYYINFLTRNGYTVIPPKEADE